MKPIIMAQVEGSGTAATEMVSSDIAVGKLTGNAGLSKPPLMSRLALAPSGPTETNKSVVPTRLIALSVRSGLNIHFI
jgi:hypothetical protein